MDDLRYAGPQLDLFAQAKAGESAGVNKGRMAKGLTSSSVLAVAVVCCILLYVSHRAALVLAAPQGHDQSWYLIAADRVLEGAQLYGPYVSDSNPPMVVWFSMLPALLSHVVPFPMLVWLRVIVLVLVLGSTVWCLRMLRWTPEAENAIIRALICFGVLYVLLRVFPMDFGQREHLFVILALPYLFAIGTGAVDRLTVAERCALGAIAGVAVCFKPQHGMAFVAAELVIAVSIRSLRRIISPEVLMMAGTCAVYLLAVRIITPAYTKQMMPVFMDTYWAYGTFTALGLLAGIKLRLLVVVLVGAFSLALWRRRPLSRLVATIAAASIGGFVAYIQQGTEWPYHRIPGNAFMILAALLCILNLMLAYAPLLEQYRIDHRIAIACCAVAALAGVALFPLQFARPKPQRSDVYRFLAAQKKPGTVLVLSTTVGWMADVLDLHWHWGGRYPCLPFFPAIVLNEQGLHHERRPFKQLSPERLTYISDLQRRVIAEDLDHFQPTVVMVEHCDQRHDCQMLEGRAVDSLAWFMQDPEFRQAWSRYEKQPGGIPSFDVYRRIP